MEKDTQKTKVIFRKFNDGEVIAIFPEIPGDYHYWSCNSYVRVGQHGSCHIRELIHTTKLAKENEYSDLFAELESFGYNLKVCKRYTPEMYDNRCKALESYK